MTCHRAASIACALFAPGVLALSMSSSGCSSSSHIALPVYEASVANPTSEGGGVPEAATGGSVDAPSEAAPDAGADATLDSTVPDALEDSAPSDAGPTDAQVDAIDAHPDAADGAGDAKEGSAEEGGKMDGGEAG